MHPQLSSPFCASSLQAEARRRSRINERLEALRQIVPHTERANTANFLEELVAYVQRLQRRVYDLEQQLGLPPSVQLPARAITFSGEAMAGGRLHRQASGLYQQKPVCYVCAFLQL